MYCILLLKYKVEIMISEEPILKLKVKANQNNSLIRLACGSEEENIKIPQHSLFALVDKIVLEDTEENRKCLRLLSRGSIELPYKLSQQVIRRCKDNFKVDVKIDLHSFAISVITPPDHKQAQKRNKVIYEILDALDYYIVLKIFKNAYESLGSKIHNRVTRKLKNYIDHAQRNEDEKKSLLAVYELYKQANEQQFKMLKQEHSMQQQQRIISKKQVKKEQIKQAIKEKRSSNVKNSFTQDLTSREKYNKDRRSNDKYRRNSRSKQTKIDDKIILGLVGDSQEGWRERMRPARVPANSMKIQGEAKMAQKQRNIKKQEKVDRVERIVKADKRIDKQQKAQKTQDMKKQENLQKPQKPQKIQKIQKQQKQKNQIKEKQTKKQVPKKIQIKTNQTQENSQSIDISENKSESGKLKFNKLFAYPEDGKIFDFSTIQNQFYICLNQNIWINYQNGTMEILKHNIGYRRKTEIQPISNGFEADGLTISLDGLSILEDGGEKIGEPTPQLILESSSQQFHVKQLVIYNKK